MYGRCNTGVTATVTWISHGDYCYHISDEKLNFTGSKKACEDLGANLTSLGSEQETNFTLDRYVTVLWSRVKRSKSVKQKSITGSCKLKYSVPR